MDTKINTVARFMISVFYMADGIALMNSFPQIDFFKDPFGSSIFFAVGCIELLSGLFMFLGYKVSFTATMLVASTFLTTIFLNSTLLDVFEALALVAGLMLIIKYNAGETFWEYAQTDIDDLPDYKVKM